MQTRSSSKLSRDQTSNPTSSTNTSSKGRIRRSYKQKVENSNFEEHLPPVATMADNRTMAEMLRVPTGGCAEAIVVPSILAEQFKLKHSLINMITSEQFFRLKKDNPHDHIRWGSPPVARKRTPTYKDLLRACPHHGFTELHQLDTFYNALNPADQDSLNAAAGGNLLKKSPQDALRIIENKSKQTNVVTTAMTAMLKQLQANSLPAPVKAVEEIYVTCGVAGNYNQGKPDYHPQGVANQMRPPGFAQPNVQYNQNQNQYSPPQCVNRGSGSLSSNTISNLKGELKAITTRSRLVTEGPTVPTPPKSVTPDVAVIQKKLPEKLRDPGKFLIPCGFSELKCKALADLGASINLMPLYIWEELGLPELIPTRMTLELANRAICTPDRIARDVFVLFGKFTFPADFVIVDYESDPRVPLILGRPFLRTTHVLIDVHDEEIILRDGDERLTFNMKHDTTSYSNHPHRESVSFINIFNVSSEDFLKVSVSNLKSGNPTFSLQQELTSPKVTHDIHDSEECNDIHPHFDDDPLSGSTTYFSNSLLEEFTDELALITYPPDYDDNLQFDIEFDLREKELLLYQGQDSSLKDSIDQMDLANLDDNFDDYFFDPIPEMFTVEHAPDYSSPPTFDGEKIEESKLLIDELDLPCDFIPYSEYDSFNSQDFSRVDALPSTKNEDKPGHLAVRLRCAETKVATWDDLAFKLITLRLKKTQKRTKSNQNWEAWRSREKSEAVTVDRGRKTKENTKRRAVNANTCKVYSSFKERKKRKGLKWIEEEKLKKTQKEGP
uniref:Reverse transcriptase domain-containing protein n=1 Tax=Tanacetum cinerariifolium TaxID=118510 RepID=A0A6L2NT93_TANCI|nr:reverse transcriptase domain-containing protein [Tanacetum cinerariifolium]